MSNKNKIERELEQKEFESEIERDLRKQELDREYEEKFDSDYHPAGLVAIRFFGNLAIGYIAYRVFIWFFYWFGGGFIATFSPEIIIGIKTIFHILIVGFAIIGVITKKSPWERFIR